MDLTKSIAVLSLFSAVKCMKNDRFAAVGLCAAVRVCGYKLLTELIYGTSLHKPPLSWYRHQQWTHRRNEPAPKSINDAGIYSINYEEILSVIIIR